VCECLSCLSSVHLNDIKPFTHTHTSWIYTMSQQRWTRIRPHTLLPNKHADVRATSVHTLRAHKYKYKWARQNTRCAKTCSIISVGTHAHTDIRTHKVHMPSNKQRSTRTSIWPEIHTHTHTHTHTNTHTHILVVFSPKKIWRSHDSVIVHFFSSNHQMTSHMPRKNKHEAWLSAVMSARQSSHQMSQHNKACVTH